VVGLVFVARPLGFMPSGRLLSRVLCFVFFSLFFSFVFKCSLAYLFIIVTLLIKYVLRCLKK
jgi:hypothetical protein